MSQTSVAAGVVQLLNKQVANWTVLYVKLHNYHWFVKGQHFFTLHAQFQSMYEEAAGYIDELAERLLALKGTPVATMKACLETAAIKEAAGGETAENMVQTLAGDYAMLVADCNAGIEAAEREKDDATADLFTGMRAALEKHIWMLNAYLGK